MLSTTYQHAANHAPLIPDEDIKLNSQVFHWPEQLQTMFDASTNKLQTGREKSEDELKAKVKAFEEKLNGYEKEVDSFRKKEVCTERQSSDRRKYF